MDERTRKNIDTLLPEARPWAEAHVNAIIGSGRLPKGWTVRIISGNRTWREQDALFAKGRTAPGNIVTNARGGQSNHNFGVAWDIGLFDDRGRYVGNHSLYSEIGDIGEDLGLEWGGRWKSIKDFPHYQVPTGMTTAQMRAVVQRGGKVNVPRFGGSHAPKVDRRTVTIVDGDRPTTIPAFFEAGRVWVAVRPFTDQFGGDVVMASPPNFSIELHDEIISFEGRIEGGVGYAKFADINRALDWGFSFAGNTLTIDTKEPA